MLVRLLCSERNEEKWLSVCFNLSNKQFRMKKKKKKVSLNFNVYGSERLEGFHAVRLRVSQCTGKVFDTYTGLYFVKPHYLLNIDKIILVKFSVVLHTYHGNPKCTV